MRTVKSSNDFFDILDSINGGAIVTIGYVTSADLNVPIVKRKNPLTNRMKGYNDYSVFQNESGREIGALVKVTSYNFNYRNRQSVHDEYHNKIKPQMNAIRQEFGVPEVQTKASYKDVVKFGGNGQEVYKGGNESKFGNSYSPQNMFKPLHVKGVVYLVDTQGNIIRGLDEKEVVPYLKAKKEPTGVSALRKMGADEERIQEYINRIKELKFSYRNFEANSILYIVATVNGEKIIYINDNLKRCVDDIDINPQDFIAVAKDRYKKDLQAIQEMFLRNKKKINENINMKKNLIRLTEGDLHRIIKESVNNILNELDHRTYHNAAMKDYDPERIKEFQKARDNEFNKKYAYHDENGNDVRLVSRGNEILLYITIKGGTDREQRYLKYEGDENFYASDGGYVKFPNVMGDRKFARILSKVVAAFENMCSKYVNGAYNDRHQEVDFHKFLGKRD